MSNAYPRQIELYINDDGKIPFNEWLSSIKDTRLKNEVRNRLDRVLLGNFGDHKSVGNDVYELRIKYGAGYRIYYAETETTIVLLLCAGDKSSQSEDIKNAKLFWQDYKENSL
ncbi:MAG: type II toxin-antitoxin system RelE/ParE family toxin [Blastocatellia bacterium]